MFPRHLFWAAGDQHAGSIRLYTANWMDRAHAQWDVRPRQVGLRQIGSRGAWALIAVMGIVALLGYQQYRWIVRVVDVEETTNREKLASSLKAFGDDFDTEVTRADLALAGLAGRSSADVLEKARERLHIFRELSKYPGLIASVEVTEELPDPFRVAAGPPPVLVLPAGFIQTSTRSRPGQYLAVQPFASGAPNVRAATGAGMQFGGSPVTVRAVLDQAYIVGTLVPALLNQHLGSDPNHRYDALVRTARTGDIVLQTGGKMAREGEVSRAIFSVRPECLTDRRISESLCAAEIRPVSSRWFDDPESAVITKRRRQVYGR